MTDHPQTSKHGPVRVTYADVSGRPERWDRYWQMDCGLLQLYDEGPAGDAIAVPVERIKEIEYLGW